MTAPQPEPHSRWRLKDSVERLATSYDAASVAVDAFARSALAYDPLMPRTTVRATFRAARRHWVARRGWPRAFWFVATAVLAGAFMAWISLRILRHFIPGTPPAVLAMVPGVLLTLTLAGTAALTAGPVARPVPRRSSLRRRPPVWPAVLFAMPLVGCAAWVTIWLTSTEGIAAWAALPTAALSVGLTGAALLAACQPAPPCTVATPLAVCRPTPPPRRLLAQQRNAQERLRGHARNWSTAAHRCGVAVDGSAEAQMTLMRLLTNDIADMPLGEIGAFHTQILTALFRYRPDPLSIRLHNASRRLLPREAGHDRG